jgi:DNA-binding LytR/AlgR family response regulator
MKILIIEDELPAANRLQQLMQSLEPDWEVIKVIDSIEDTVIWLKEHSKPDLIFMDIQLADGFSFEIFEQIEVESPVIFATAFNEYAINAFKVNGLDYLLKPIETNELERAIGKFKTYFNTPAFDYSHLSELLKKNDTQTYKERFLIKMGEQMKFIQVKDIAYFLSEDGYVFIVSDKNDRFILDDPLEQIIKKLNPGTFFQINRKMILHIDSIQKINTYFNSRLKLELAPDPKTEVIVSRERAKGFKQWLDQ